MELELEGNPTFGVEGRVTIELPGYMKMLPAEELKEVRTAANRDGLIIAAGRRPRDGDIVFLTGAGEIMELSFEEFPLLGDPVAPIDFGCSVKIGKGLTEVASSWMIHNAAVVMVQTSMATLVSSCKSVTYVDDNEDDDREAS